MPTSRQIIVERYRRKFRQEIFGHYGGKCACCGYCDIFKRITQSGYTRYFLQVDHINGFSGGRHRDAKYRGNQFYHLLKNQGYPDGYRVLCAACNAAMETGQDKCELHRGN